MGDADFVVDVAVGGVAEAVVEALSGELGAEVELAEAAGGAFLFEGSEDGGAQAAAAMLPEDGHPANLAVLRSGFAAHDEAAGGDRRAVEVGNAVNRRCVGVVEFFLSGDLLFFHEDGDADGEGVVAVLVGRGDDDVGGHRFIQSVIHEEHKGHEGRRGTVRERVWALSYGAPWS